MHLSEGMVSDLDVIRHSRRISRSVKDDRALLVVKKRLTRGKPLMIRSYNAIEKGISFMKGNQLESGEFVTLASPTIQMNKPRVVPSVYIPTYVIHSLGFVKTIPFVDEMIRKGISFLLDQREEDNIWRFHGKTIKDPPPDFDDTCCVLAALKDNGMTISDSIFDLLSRFKSHSGLYHTWIDEKMNRMASRKTDGAVNANILFYSGLCGNAQQDLIMYFNEKVLNEEYQDLSMYAMSDYPVIYLITRAYCDANVTGLKTSMHWIIRHLIERQEKDGSWGNEIESALATISLLNAGCRSKDLQRAIRNILGRQQENGGWPIGAFFQDFGPAYYGSQELTTAFCIEALKKYSMISSQVEDRSFGSAEQVGVTKK